MLADIEKHIDTNIKRTVNPGFWHVTTKSRKIWKLISKIWDFYTLPFLRYGHLKFDIMSSTFSTTFEQCEMHMRVNIVTTNRLRFLAFWRQRWK